MTSRHAEVGIPRPFKPTGKGGGSEKGKPQWLWPLFAVVAADALVLRAKGTADAWTIDRRRPFALDFLVGEMERLFPGFWVWVLEQTPRHTTPRARLLYNRVYKGHYSGTSDRGMNHDPKTRACQAQEHWLKRVPLGHPLRDLHDQIYRGLQQPVPDWRMLP